MGQSLSSDVNSHSSNQEIPQLLWNQNVHSRVHKTWSLEPIMSQINPIVDTDQIRRRTNRTSHKTPREECLQIDTPSSNNIVAVSGKYHFKPELSSKRSSVCQAVCRASLLSHLWHFASVQIGASVLLRVIFYLKSIDECRRLENIQWNRIGWHLKPEVFCLTDKTRTVWLLIGVHYDISKTADVV
jgi:hypothetical protein